MHSYGSLEHLCAYQIGLRSAFEKVFGFLVQDLDFPSCGLNGVVVDSCCLCWFFYENIFIVLVSLARILSNESVMLLLYNSCMITVGLVLC